MIGSIIGGNVRTCDGKENGVRIWYPLSASGYARVWAVCNRSGGHVCDSVNYITEPDELEEVFRLVNNYLDPKGFLFDFNTVHKYRDVIGDSTIAEDRGAVALFGITDTMRKNRSTSTIWRCLSRKILTLWKNAYVSERTADSKMPCFQKKERVTWKILCFRRRGGEKRKFISEIYGDALSKRVYLPRYKEQERAGLVFIEAYDADTKETPNDTWDEQRICVIARVKTENKQNE